MSCVHPCPYYSRQNLVLTRLCVNPWFKALEQLKALILVLETEKVLGTPLLWSIQSFDKKFSTECRQFKWLFATLQTSLLTSTNNILQHLNNDHIKRWTPPKNVNATIHNSVQDLQTGSTSGYPAPLWIYATLRRTETSKRTYLVAIFSSTYAL